MRQTPETEEEGNHQWALMNTKIEMRRALLANVLVNCVDCLITLASDAVLFDHEKEE
jgi:hypothetical protein